MITINIAEDNKNEEKLTKKSTKKNEMKSNFNNFNTPNITRKEKMIEVEIEMRRTSKMKPPLISSKFPAAFEITKRIDLKKSPLEKIEENNKDLNEKEKEKEISNKYNLEPIKLKTVRRNKNYKQEISNILVMDIEKIEVDNKFLDEVVSRKKNKMLLKPIEIRDPRRLNHPNNNSVESRNIDYTIEKSPNIRTSIEKYFSKTSNFNFKIIEDLNIEGYSNEIKRLEENLKLNPGDIMKNINMLKNKSKINDNNDSYKLKLEEMITLNMINSTKTCGSIKKMVHAPSLKFYTVREVPLINKEIRNSLFNILEKWRSSFETDNPHAVYIHSDYINSPEGFHSIIMDYSSFGSLENLINNMGSLTENILRRISFKIIESLEKVLDKIEIYEGICLSNILFDSNFNVKVKYLFKLFR